VPPAPAAKKRLTSRKRKDAAEEAVGQVDQDQGQHQERKPAGMCGWQDTNNNQGCCLMCTSKNMQPPMCDAVSDLFVCACVRE